MTDVQDGNASQPFSPDTVALDGTEQELALQNLLDQNLLTITGQLGPISLPQFMTLSGNACKLYCYCSSAGWVGIPLQEDRLPFGVGLKDIRTVFRVLQELWQHRCIEVRFAESAVETPQDLRLRGKTVVLETEAGVLPIPRIYVRCVGFPEHLPYEVAGTLDAKVKRQIAYHQKRVVHLQEENTWWEQRIRRQSAPRDPSQHTVLAVTQGLAEERNGESPLER